MSPYVLVNPDSNELETAGILCDYLDAKFKSAYIDLHVKGMQDQKEIFENSGFTVVEKSNSVLDLRLSSEELIKNLSSTRRRHIRKSERELTLVFNDRIEESFTLFKKTYSDNGLQIPQAYFEILESDYFLEERVISAVLHDDKVVSANLCLQAGEISLYLLGGIDKSSSLAHAGSASLWNCILQSKKRGAILFDFCGSSVPGIARYFSSFGASPEPYLQIKKGHEQVDFVKKIKSKLLP